MPENKKDNQQTEEFGIHFVHGIATKMNFIFREQLKHDFGIDAHIELKDENGNALGRMLGVQIKSGESYISWDNKGNIVYRPVERHIKYWAEYPLPVILVIYSPNEDKAWWCDVKEYISRYPQILGSAPYKITIPSSSLLTVNSKEDFIRIGFLPDNSLNLNQPYYEISSHRDTSTNAKKYMANILVNNGNENIIRLAIFQAIQELKVQVEHSTEKQQSYWKNHPPHLIIIYVYLSKNDEIQKNHIARALWRDSQNESTKQFSFKGNDFVEDIEIDFVDKEKHLSWRSFIASKQVSKLEFLRITTHWLAQIDPIIDRAKELMKVLETSKINVEMGLLSQKFDAIPAGLDVVAPYEYYDMERYLRQTYYSALAIFRYFKPEGLKHYPDGKSRNWMINEAWKGYTKDRQILDAEILKAKNR